MEKIYWELLSTKLVISDTNFLKSLPKREIICGYAEILKHSLIIR